MTTRDLALLFAFVVAAIGTSACSHSDANNDTCFGGCACNTTPATCPAGCGATYTQTADGSTVFSCENVTDAGTGEQ